MPACARVGVEQARDRRRRSGGGCGRGAARRSSASAVATASCVRARRRSDRSATQRVRGARTRSRNATADRRRRSRRTGRAASRRRDSSSSGHSIARERCAQRDHLLAAVQRAAADQHVRDAPRLERAHVGARDVLPKPSGSAGTAGTRGAPRPARARPPSVDRAAAVAAAASRRTRPRPPDTRSRPIFAVCVRSPSRCGRGPAARAAPAAPACAARYGAKRDVVRLAAVLGARHQRRERRRSTASTGCRAAMRKLVVRCTSSAPCAEQAPLDALVEHHVGAPEAVDRLLRIADHEQLAGHDARSCRSRRRPRWREYCRISACSGSVSWNSSTNRCVKRGCSSARTRASSRRRLRVHSSRSRKSSAPGLRLRRLARGDDGAELVPAGAPRGRPRRASRNARAARARASRCANTSSRSSLAAEPASAAAPVPRRAAREHDELRPRARRSRGRARARARRARR